MYEPMMPHTHDARCKCTDGLAGYRDIGEACNAPLCPAALAALCTPCAKQRADGPPPYDAATATGMYDHDDYN